MVTRNGITKTNVIRSLALLVLILAGPTHTSADLKTIDFDHLPEGTPIDHGTPLTDAYAEYGIKLYCVGSYPDFKPVPDYPKDNNAYAYRDHRAFSGNNVIGGRIIGDYFHWLNFYQCYGVAEFTDPVDYMSIYGVGSPFQVFYYDQYGNRKGPFPSAPDRFLEVFPERGDLIKRIEFGSYTGDYCTYFDDLTFSIPLTQPVPLIDGLSPAFCEPETAIRIVGRNFGSGQADGRVVHIGGWRKGGPTSPRINWADTEIMVRIPTYGCELFPDGQQFRRVNVWVTVDGIDSNTKVLTAYKPTTCQ